MTYSQRGENECVGPNHTRKERQSRIPNDFYPIVCDGVISRMLSTKSVLEFYSR